MYVSLHLSDQSRGGFEDLEIIEAAAKKALRADEAGFAALALTEHHFAGFNTYSDPFIFGGYLAGRLRQAYLAITVVQMMLRHPIRTAEYCNLLDNLTKGRLMIGLAPGSASAIEMSAFGITGEHRYEMTRQRTDTMLKAWAHTEDESPVDISTDFEKVILSGRLMPTSYRQPRPLLGRATLTEATIIETAQMGWPLLLGGTPDPMAEESQRSINLYFDTLESSGHPTSTVKIGRSWLSYLRHVCVAETEQKARERFQEYLEVGGSGPTPGKEGISDGWEKDWTRRQLSRVQNAVVGTPDMVVENLLRFANAGLEHVRVGFVSTSGKTEESDESFELFIREVLPHLNPQSLPGPEETVSSGSKSTS